MNDSITVGELCEAIEFAITTCFPTELWVEGTVSGISRSSAGHVYFDFVDAESQTNGRGAVLPVALFVGAKNRVNSILKQSGAARITDGVELKIKGRVAYYPPQGRIQLIMSSIDPAFTLGKLELARARLLTELTESGLLLANSQVHLPTLPLSVALVTSPGSAAEADFLSELSLSRYPFEVIKVPTLVQGTEAPTKISSALESAEATKADCIVLIRGGGAQSDLAAFDSPKVAYSIANSTKAVIVGIGHETDSSVADQVAHSSLKTPTAAAAFLINRVANFAERVDSCADRIQMASSMSLVHHSNRLDRLAERSLAGATQKLANEHHLLDRAELRSKALDPTLIMARGWSITFDEDGKPVTDAKNLSPGQLIRTQLASGQVSSEIIKVGPSSPESLI